MSLRMSWSEYVTKKRILEELDRKIRSNEDNKTKKIGILTACSGKRTSI